MKKWMKGDGKWMKKMEESRWKKWKTIDEKIG